MWKMLIVLAVSAAGMFEESGKKWEVEFGKARARVVCGFCDVQFVNETKEAGLFGMGVAGLEGLRDCSKFSTERLSDYVFIEYVDSFFETVEMWECIEHESMFAAIVSSNYSRLPILLSKMLRVFSLKNQNLTAVLFKSHEKRMLAGCTLIGCSICAQGTQGCLTCNTGYYLNNKLCSPCSYGCRNCFNQTSCTQCQSSFYLQSNQTCLKCMSNCNICYNDSVCALCDYGYYIQSNRCFPCATGCQVCSNSTNCVLCSNSFYLSGQVCKQCTPFCLTCNATNCLSCRSGFFLHSNSLCLPCSKNCLNCTDGVTCTNCDSKYYLTFSAGQSICQQCSSDCVSCTSSSSCQQCKALHFYLNITNCVACMSGCRSCGTVVACDNCNDGFMITSENTCASCSDLSNCAFCTNSTYCSSCFYPGFYMDSNSACIQCSDNCKSCISSTYCQICNDGYYLSTAKTCIKCISNCLSCASVCTGCENGFYIDLKTETCQACMPGCIDCTSGSVCTACLKGFMLTNQGYCRPCSEYCATCSLTGCVSCYQGYYLDTSNQCRLCTSNCLSCSATACLVSGSGISPIVTSCPERYYNDGSICSHCVPNCLSCISSTICSQCAQNFFRNTTGLCIACKAANCGTCSAALTPCIDCQTGYFKASDSSCKPCSYGCLDCISLKECSSCIKGFQLSNGYCLSCVPYCISCSGNICSLCQPGYYLQSSNTCSLCSSNCLLCTDSATCTACATGYNIRDGSCITCVYVTVISSYFTADFSKIIVEFSRDILNTQALNCTEIFRSSGKLGSGSWCQAVGHSFVISLGRGYIFTSITAFSISTEKLFNYVCESSQAIFSLTAVYTSIPQSPTGVIIAPSVVSLQCPSSVWRVYISRIEGNYNNTLIYQWDATTVPYSEPIETFIKSQINSKFELPISMFNGVETTVNISLIIKNVIDRTNSVWYLGKSSSEKLFQLEIDAGRSMSLLADQGYYIIGRVIDSCNVTTRIIYAWTLSYTDDPNFDKKLVDTTSLSYKIYVYPLAFRPGFSYIYNLTATSELIKGTESINLTARNSPLVIVLSKTSSSISPIYDLIISASGSYDPSKYGNLIYKWSCVYASTQQSCNHLLKSDNTTLLFINKTSLVIGQSFNISFTMSHAETNRVSKKYISLDVIDSFTSIDIQVPSEVINSQTSLLQTCLVSTNTTLSFNWSLVSGSELTIKPKNLPGLYIPVDQFMSGANYKFRIEALEASGKVSYAFLQYSVNSIPTCIDNLAVIPDTGQAFSTVFIFFINTCSDSDQNFPLTYRFSVISSTEISYTISTAKQFNFVKTKLFQGNITGVVNVCDTLSGCLKLQTPISVNPAKDEIFDANDKMLTSWFIEDTVDSEMIPISIGVYQTVFNLNFAVADYFFNELLIYTFGSIVNIDSVLIVLELSMGYLDPKYNSQLSLNRIKNTVNFFENLVYSIKGKVDYTVILLCVQIAQKLLVLGFYEAQYVTIANSFVAFVANVFDQTALPGNFIVDITYKNYRYFKFKTLAKDLLDGGIPNMGIVDNVYQIATVANNSIINIQVTDYGHNDNYSSIGSYAISSSGTYENYSLTFTQEAPIYLNTTAAELVLSVPNSSLYKSWVCIQNDGTSWSDQGCSIASISTDTIKVAVSTSLPIRAMDAVAFYSKSPSTYGPVITAALLLAVLIVGFGLLFWLDWKNSKKLSEVKDSKGHEEEVSTWFLIIRNTLVLSVLSNDPELKKAPKVASLMTILIIQLCIEGAFVGQGVIDDSYNTRVAGIGFISSLLTIPHNVIASYNFSLQRKVAYIVYLSVCAVQFLICFIGIIVLTINVTQGKNSEWITAFFYGLLGELFVEIGVMLWKNIREQSESLVNNTI